MKILLVQPPFNVHLIGAGTFYLNEPLALETIAAGVPDHEVRILDMRIVPTLMETVREFNPDIVGVTAYTTDVYKARAIFDEVKKYRSSILTVIGGHHAMCFPEDFNYPYIDVIVIGEGQSCFAELVAVFQQKGDMTLVPGLIVRGEKGREATAEKKITNLDMIKQPARKLTAHYRNHYFRGKCRPIASMVTSRGCPYRCNFCSVWKRENGRYQVCSPERVVAEIQSIDEEYISIGDDNFFQDCDRAEAICRLIKSNGIKKRYKLIGRTDTIVKRPDIVEKWREIGADAMFLGLESFHDQDIKKLGKTTSIEINNKAISILHNNGIEVIGQFIINPDYTCEDFEALAEYVIRMRLKQPLFSILTPLPGTDLYEERKGDILTHNYEMYDLAHSVLPTKLPRQEFYRCYAQLYKTCYADNYSDSNLSMPQAALEKMYRQLLNAYTLD